MPILIRSALSPEEQNKFVKYEDIASTNFPGIAKVVPANGVTLRNINELAINKATDAMIKNGTDNYRSLVPANQHTSVFYGLAKSAGDTTQSQSSNEVGAYTDEAKAAIQSMLGIDLSNAGSVKDVTVNGTSILDSETGVAEIPVASNSNLGVIGVNGTYGIGYAPHVNSLVFVNSGVAETKLGTSQNRAVLLANQHHSVFYGLAKAAGDTTQSQSANAVGTYTPEAALAIRNMIGATGESASITVTGTDPVIQASSNARYICGEVATLSFTPCASGICEVIFTSGTTPTVLTLPQTVQMPEWFEVEANHTYEISVIDGTYGAVMVW